MACISTIPVTVALHVARRGIWDADKGVRKGNTSMWWQVIRLALQDAHMQPSSVNVLEMHGTGTALGDPIEVSTHDAAVRHLSLSFHYWPQSSLGMVASWVKVSLK